MAIIAHHSITDWDFESAEWTLDGVIYHTAPPSLHGIIASGAALVKHATTGALSDGRIIAWVRSSSAAYLPWFIFRNQKVDGGADSEDTYRLQIYDDHVDLISYIAGVQDIVQAKDHTWGWLANTWYKLRLTWWTSVDRIYVRIERWTGTEWVTLGGEADIDFEDTDDLWKDNPVNRCGLLFFGVWWQDDVEVWA